MGSLLRTVPLPDTTPPTAKQQQRLAAALLAVLTALAEERHPCDDAWQTATVATLHLLDACAATQPALAGQVLTPAGRSPLQSVLVRLGSCCQGPGTPLGAHGVGAIHSAARVVFSVHQQMHAVDPASAAGASWAWAEFGCLLMAPLLRLFAPPHPIAGACTCPGGAPTAANAAVCVHAESYPARDAYGVSFSHVAPLETVSRVASVCHNAAVFEADAQGAMVAAGWRRLCTMALAHKVDAGRRLGHPRAFAGAAGAADPARFVHLAIVTPAAALDDLSATVGGALLALDPHHAPACARCLPDQLMLVLEGAALVDDPQDAAHCYKALASMLIAASRGEDIAAASSPLREFCRRAWPHLCARALEAARAAGQAPEGDAGASRHAAVVDALAAALTLCVRSGCQPDDGAALDAVCEAAARTRPPWMYLPAWRLFAARLGCVLSASGASSPSAARDDSPPRALAAVMVSIGKLLQVHSAADARAFPALKLSASFICSMNDGDGEPAAPGSAAGPAIALDSGGGEGLSQLLVLMAARVVGAAARRALLEGGEALLPADECEQLKTAAAQLQRPLLWGAVQRATHGRVAPLKIGASMRPDHPSTRPAAAGTPTVRRGATAGATRADAHNDSGDGGSGSSGSGCSSACTAALRFLAELHERLDPHALGVRLPGCYNPRCTNVSGASEADLPVRRCSGCRVARYCSAACSKQHWHWHKAACRLAAGSAAQP